MSYLKSVGTSFIYIAFFLAIITFTPGLPPPNAEFNEYSIESPKKLGGDLGTNRRLDDPEILFKGQLKGPESFDSWNGELYTGLHGGLVVKINGEKIIPVVKFGKNCDGVWEEEKCGRPLGLKFDKQGQLYVIDTYYGLFKVDVKTGKYQKIVDISQPIDGLVPQLINSLDIAKNGDIYYTDSSSQFKLYDGAFIGLADPAGRLIRYNAGTKKNEVLLKNLGFANGVVLSDDESYVIVAETMKSTIIKYNLRGAKSGKSEIFVDGLPGVPDNIHSDGYGNYLVSLVVPADEEHPLLGQTLIPHPSLRKMIARLLAIVEYPFQLLGDYYPNDFAKKVTHALGHFETIQFLNPQSSTVLKIDKNGKIIDALYSTDEKLSGISSAYIHDNYLWLGSPFNDYLARIPLKKAFPDIEIQTKQKVIAEKPRVVEKAKVVATQDEKPVATSTTQTTASSKSTSQSTEKLTTTEAPKVQKPGKVEQVKPVSSTEKQQVKREAEKKPEIEKIPQKVAEEPTKPPKKVETVKKATTEETNELPKPIKQAESAKPSKQAEPVKPSKPAEPIKQSKQAEPAKQSKQPESTKESKQPEIAKPQKSAEPAKRNTKFTDEI